MKTRIIHMETELTKWLDRTLYVLYLIRSICRDSKIYRQISRMMITVRLTPKYPNPIERCLTIRTSHHHPLFPILHLLLLSLLSHKLHQALMTPQAALDKTCHLATTSTTPLVSFNV